MAKKTRPRGGVEFYVKGRKRPIAYSTLVVSNSLALLHEEHPSLTISQLRELLADESKYVGVYDDLAVLDAHIACGHGDDVPNWIYW